MFFNRTTRKPRVAPRLVGTAAAMAGALAAPAVAQHAAKPKTVDWAESTKRFGAKALETGPAAATADEKAVSARPGKGRQGYLVRKRAEVPASPNAKYRLGLALRLHQKSSKAPLLRIEAIHHGDRRSTVCHWAVVRAKDAPQKKGFHTYVTGFKRPPRGKLGLRVYWFGYAGVDVRAAWIERQPLPTERERLRNLDAFDAPEDPPAVKATKRTLAVLGPYHWTYGIPDRLPGSVTATYAKGREGPNAIESFRPDFPGSYEALWRYDVVVLCDVGAEQLGVAGRKRLADFVRSGGGLLVLGGFRSYGKAKLQGTFLEDLLPVRVGGRFDLRELEPARRIEPADPPWKAAAWKDGRVMYAHRVEPRDGARVAWRARDRPLLVLGTRGAGRVAAFVGTVLGTATDGASGFWDTPAWGKALEKIVGWLRGGKQ